MMAVNHRRRLLLILLSLTFIIAAPMYGSIVHATGEQPTNFTIQTDKTVSTNLTVTINGTASWNSIISELKGEIQEQEANNIIVSNVTFTGAGSDAVIEFTSDEGNIRQDFDYNTTFDNIALKVVDERELWMFAKGHDLVTTDSVTTSGTIKVFGGGNEEEIESDTNVELNGGNYALVVGGGYEGSVDGSTNVYIKGNATVNAPAGSLDAVFGGGYKADVTGDTFVDINDDAVVTGNVWGGGYESAVDGDTWVYLEGSSTINAPDGGIGVIASGEGSNFTEHGTSGSATIFVIDDAVVNGYFYGDYGMASDSYLVGNGTSVVFDTCIGEYRGIAYTGVVDITGGSDVTIDDSTADNSDYAQFIKVDNMKIHDAGKLTLLSNARIDGNYMGALSSNLKAARAPSINSTSTGTLVLRAGKHLEIGGTVRGKTNLSIIDDNSDGTVTPSANQVYIISDAGSTDSSATFSWTDERGIVELTWTDDTSIDNAPNASQWYLKSTKTQYNLTLIYDQLWHGYNSLGLGTTPDVITTYDEGSIINMAVIDPNYKWYYDDSYSLPADGIFTLNGDTVLYADATINGDVGGGSLGGDLGGGNEQTGAFHLSYNSNGGSYIRAVTLTEPTDIDFDDPNYIPTRDGYEFTGWYTDYDLTDKVSGINTVSDNLTVFAGWNEASDDTQTVTLRLVYDSLWSFIGVGTPDVTKDFTSGSDVVMKDIDNSYIWYYDSSFENKVPSSFKITADTTLYAGEQNTSSGDDSQTESTFYLSYQSNGGTYIAARKLTGATDVDFDDSTYIPTRDGYTFTGWYTDSSLGERLTGVHTISDYTTVYAGWEAVDNSGDGTDPSVDPDDGTGSGSDASVDPKKDTDVNPGDSKTNTPSGKTATKNKTVKTAKSMSKAGTTAAKKTSSKAGSTSGTVQTNDESNAPLWIMLMVLSAMGAAGAGLSARTRRRVYGEDE